MKRAVGSRELKTRLGTYLQQVRAGAALTVTERGIPVATLQPIPPAELSLDDRLARLRREGIVSGRGCPLAPFEPIECLQSASQAISKDREDRF
jgi:prevent-host-death family protein